MNISLTCILLLLSASTFGATYFVRTNGNDSTGDGSTGNPWRTISKANSTVAANDTVLLGDGAYLEHTTVTKPLTFRAESTKGGPQTRGMRLQTNVVLDGINFRWFGDAQLNWGGSWAASVRLDTAAHNSIITNCVFGPSMHVATTNFTFIPGSPTNAIYSPLADFNAAGFQTNAHIYLGASGLDGFWFTNHNTAWMVHSISGDGHTLFVTNNTGSSFSADPGTNYWSLIHGGNGSESLYAIAGVLTSGAMPTNIVVASCVFSNWVGHGIYGYFNGSLIQSNLFTHQYGYRPAAFNGDEIMFRDNISINRRAPVRYTLSEGVGLVHPGGGGWYDYDVGELQATIAGSTNITIYHNWFEDIDNQIGLADPFTNSVGFYIVSNVFVGWSEHFSGGRSSLWFNNNTFYKTAYDQGRSSPLGLGSSGTPVYDLQVTKNIFADNGDKISNTNFAGWYTISTNAISPVLDSNYVTTAEILGWQGRSGFTNEVHGINGGDPLFVNPASPRGPDGIPWTEDDGLRPMPGSVIANAGIGALAPPTNSLPYAHFRVTSPLGWKDATDESYNPVWVAQTPWDRALTGTIRPWQTPALLGAPPLFVQFTATNSYSPAGVDIESYTWDFGDGTVVTRQRHDVYIANPEAWHWFTRTGTFNVKLTITNLAGQSDSYTNAYRVEGAFTKTVYHVSTNGNDSTGTGSQSAPWRTIQKAATNMFAGAMTAVQAGDYNENVDVAKAAHETNRAYFIGHGAKSGRFNMRVGDYTIDGFQLSTNAGSLGLVYCYPTAHRIYVLNNILGPATNNTFAVNMVQGVNAIPGNSSSFNIFSNNILSRLDYIGFNMSGGTNQVRDNWAIGGNNQADFCRPSGMAPWIDGNVMENIGLIDSTHIDLVQWFGFRSEVNFGWNPASSPTPQIPTDGNSFTINGDTRTWRNTVSTAATEILIAGSLGACATNMWNHLSAFPIAGAVPQWESGPNIAIRSPISGVQLTYSRGGTWSYYTASETPEQWFKDAVITRNYYKQTVGQVTQLETYEEDTNHVGNNIWAFNVFTEGGAANLGANQQYFFNNTFYYATTNTGHVLGGGGTKGTAYGTKYYNNAFIRCGSDPENTGFGWYNTSPMLSNGSLESDWNFVVGGSGTNWEAKAEYSGTDSFQKFRSYGLDPNSLNPGVDPLLLNPAGFDYRPATNSPLYGAGTNIYALLPSFARRDIQGNALSSTNAWSIGAFQVSGTASLGGGGGGEEGGSTNTFRIYIQGGIIYQGRIDF